MLLAYSNKNYRIYHSFRSTFFFLRVIFSDVDTQPILSLKSGCAMFQFSHNSTNLP
uniref:Uncharacterized protein n=1 Tax=Arundo donax TaxID=35708 RepID=A0A0A9GQC9_ARUDO